MAFGVTATGFTIKRLDDIQGEMVGDLLKYGGAGTITTEENPIVQFFAIVSKQLAEVWEGGEQNYNDGNPNTATGIGLDRTLALTGHTRQPATKTSVPSLYAYGTLGATIQAGFKCSTAQSGNLFVSSADVTLTTQADLTAESLTSAGLTATITLTGHPYVNDDYVFIRGANETAYNILAKVQNVAANTFDYILKESTTSPATGTITIKKATNIPVEAQFTGPIQCLAGSLTVIETAGPDYIENYEDGVIGSNVETNAAFLARQKATLSLVGGGTHEAIKSRLLNVTGVQSVKVYSNNTGKTLPDGTIPYSVHAFVTGGADQDIINELVLYATSAGVALMGNVTGTATTSEGQVLDGAFSRLQAVAIYIDVIVIRETDPNEGPVRDAVDIEADILANILAYGNSLGEGQDVKTNSLLINTVASVSGLSSITSVFADKTASPTSTANVVILSTEIADIDSSRINITVN